MYTKKLFLLTILCLFSSLAWSQEPVIKINTSFGIITVKLFPEKAPRTVENFLQNIEEGMYEGAIFHRLIDNFIIQGGGYDENFNPITANEPIINESRNSLKNNKGTISMARFESDVDSADNQFFINLRDNNSLDATSNDMGYTVFGQVIDGMKSIEKISKNPIEDRGQPNFREAPLQNLIIYSIDSNIPSYSNYSRPDNQAGGKSESNILIPASSGTGFAVSHDGHIITNHHVIDACQEVKVRYKSDDILAKLIAFDTVNDLAILKIDTKPSSVLPISYSNPEILQEIYVAGFPFGENVSTSIKMTKGIVSSLTGIGNNYSNIQIDAALQPGNSGGPVFDEKGNVVGVAVAKIDLEYAIEKFGVVPENTNFGIKSSVVINFLESNSIGNLASPLDYKASMTSLGKSVTDATYYVSCMMTMAQIRKVQARKVIYSELIK